MPYKDVEKNRAYQLEWSRKNRRQQKSYKQRTAQIISEFKAANPCVDCGKKYPPYVMDLDHVTNDKIGNVNILRGYSTRDVIYKEIEKCELVCANCHRVRTYNRTMKRIDECVGEEDVCLCSYCLARRSCKTKPC